MDRTEITPTRHGENRRALDQRGCLEFVSKEWIDQSVQPLYPVTWNSNRYGFHWWVGRSTVGKKVFQWTAAWGLGGQRLFIVPESKLVVAINAGLYNSQIQAAVPIDILENFVLAAVQD